MNVLLAGMQNSDWELCAVLVDFLPFEYWLVKRRGSPWVWVYRSRAPELLPALVTRLFITPAAPHFPHDIDVLPD